MKKPIKTLVFLSNFAVLTSLTGCILDFKKDNNPVKPTPDPTPEFKEEVIEFSELLEAQEAVTLMVGETKRYDINENIAEDNYFQILLKTNKNIKGKFIYINNAKPSDPAVEEEFYIEPTNNGNDVTDFRQFLDAFRPNVKGKNKSMSVGAFQKTLKAIEFTNIQDESTTIELVQVNISDRALDEDDRMIFLEADSLKIGMDLLTGGTLSYLERTEYDGDTIDLVIDGNDNIQIGVDFSSRPKTQEISSNVNLINIYDAGRQIQQSYYGSIGGYGDTEEEKKDANNEDGGVQNGYTRNISTTADPSGYYWPYNPVQGGDEAVNFSQVIDYRKTKNELYCKTRALDWAGHLSGGNGNPDNNRVTKSYMENWFKIEDGLLYATNRFVDWNGFYDLDDIPAHNIEIPATYISHPLHVYQTYTGTEAYKEDGNGNLDKTPGNLDKKDNIGSWKNGGYRTNTHSEDWFAWTNDENFGVGVYIPVLHIILLVVVL